MLEELNQTENGTFLCRLCSVTFLSKVICSSTASCFSLALGQDRWYTSDGDTLLPVALEASNGEIPAPLNVFRIIHV